MSDCPICLEPLENKSLSIENQDENSLQFILTCKHSFHISCLKQQILSCCALCRKPFDDIEIYVLQLHNIDQDYLDQDSQETQDNIDQDYLDQDNTDLDSQETQYMLENCSEISEQDQEEWRYRYKSEYSSYIEEDPDFDEENPHGDSFGYENY